MAFQPCEANINGRIGYVTITFPALPPEQTAEIWFVDISACFSLNITNSDRGGLPFFWRGSDTPADTAYAFSQAINTWDDPTLIAARDNFSLFAHQDTNTVTLIFEVPDNACCGGPVTIGEAERGTSPPVAYLEGAASAMQCCPESGTDPEQQDIDCGEYPENKHIARVRFIDDGVVWGDPNVDSRRFIAPQGQCEQSEGCPGNNPIGFLRSEYDLEYKGGNWAAEINPGALVIDAGRGLGITGPGASVPPYIAAATGTTSSLSDYMTNVYIPGYSQYFGPTGPLPIGGYNAIWQPHPTNVNRGTLILEFDARQLSAALAREECTLTNPCECPFPGISVPITDGTFKPDFYDFAFSNTSGNYINNAAINVDVTLIQHIACCQAQAGDIPIYDWTDLSTSSYNNLGEFVDGFVAFYNGNGPISGNGVDWAAIWGGAGSPVGVRKVAFDSVEIITDFALWNAAQAADLCTDGINFCFWTPWELRDESGESYTNNLNVQVIAEQCCFERPFVPPDVTFDPPPERGREPINTDCLEILPFEQCINGVAGFKRALVLDRAFYSHVLLDENGRITKFILDPLFALWVELNPNYYETSLDVELQRDENGFRYSHRLSVAKEIMTHEARNVIHKLLERDFVIILQDGNDRYWFLGEHFPVRLETHTSSITGKNTATNRNDITFVANDYYMLREATREAVEGDPDDPNQPGINTDPEADNCDFYVGQPLGPYTLYALRDCFLYDMRNNNLN